ncbi:MAG: marine proteobacterial sortase target protein [Gammaproteobacteria bacterium]|nr:marine proteobacterial sortase target protein [Gammaproteobacteria bacterium]
MQKTINRILSRALPLPLLLLSFLAPAEEPMPGQAQSGSLLWQMQQGYVTATLLNTDVDIEISGLVARVVVRQEFHNDGAAWVEGIYVFPLPDAAAIDRMRLYIGERFIEGEIQEKEHAKKTYEAAKRAGRKASLVEQRRANLFTTSVANVAPGERVVVEIEYLEDVRYEDGRFSLRFPMTLTPRYVPGQGLPDRQGSGWSADTDRVPDASLVTPPMVSASRGNRITLAARINAGMPLESVASRYHPVTVTEEQQRYGVTLAGSDVPMDHDFELVWQPTPSTAPRAMAFTETIGGKPYHLLMLMPPDPSATPAASMPREVIFIIDTSGSMHGVSIAQAKRALHLALDGLQPHDLFNVIEFNSSTRALYRASTEASSTRIEEAKNFVRRLDANGGTEMRPALARALRTPPRETHLRQIVFITDGSVGYEDEMFSMIERQLGNARLFTVGIGSAPNSWFMRKAAEVGRGSFTFISALNEVREKMNRLFEKLAHPEVTGIDVQWPSGVVVDSYPAEVADLYLGEPVTVRARASGMHRSGDSVWISGHSMSGGWSTELSLGESQPGKGIGALWARARIAALVDEERRTQAPTLRRAIVDTAIQHHLVSKYTSLIAVDKTPLRPAGGALSSEQVANLMPYGQNGSEIFGFPATATGAPMLRIAGIAWLSMALLLFAALRVSRRWRHVRPG